MSKVSVITPAFNASKYILKTIESVAAQDTDQMEMIIVDDNSTDNTHEILKEAQKKYPFIRVFHNKKNMGPAFCRNLGIRKSRWKYIAFLDADDLWLPHKVRTQLAYMQERKIDFSYSSYLSINQDGLSTGRIITGEHGMNYQKLLFNCPIGCLTVMYDKTRFKPTYMPNIARGQDYGLWLKLLKQNANIGYIEEPLAMYRKTAGSISSAKKKKIANMFDLYNNHLKINTFLSYIYIASHILHSFLKSRGLTNTQRIKNTESS